MKNENALRRVFRAEMRLEAAPEAVFPLLCPVREYDWIEGWECELLHTVSGVAELDCVFRTRMPEEGEETWTISRYDVNRCIEFVRVAAGSTVTRMSLELEEIGPGLTRLVWTTRSTALGPAGTASLEARSDAAHATRLRVLELMANHYLRTGTRLPRAEALRQLAG